MPLLIIRYTWHAYGDYMVRYHSPVSSALNSSRAPGRETLPADSSSSSELRQLGPLERETSPFGAPVPPRYARGAHWVEPRLAGEVAFTEWTADGSMRHPSWRGLRAGKNPGAVHREALTSRLPITRGPRAVPGAAYRANARHGAYPAPMARAGPRRARGNTRRREH